jgi:hypothetical protein
MSLLAPRPQRRLSQRSPPRPPSEHCWQTKGILERAGETAEQITAAARREAEGDVSSAKAEAEATVAQAQSEADERLRRTEAEITTQQEEAETRMRELGADTETIRQERSRLLDDIRELATRVGEVAGAADARFPPPTTAQQVRERSRKRSPARQAQRKRLRSRRRTGRPVKAPSRNIVDRKARLARQRGAVRALPAAHPVNHSIRPVGRIFILAYPSRRFDGAWMGTLLTPPRASFSSTSSLWCCKPTPGLERLECAVVHEHRAWRRTALSSGVLFELGQGRGGLRWPIRCAPSNTTT